MSAAEEAQGLDRQAVQHVARLWACPACGAAPAQRCTALAGTPTWRVHEGRAAMAGLGPYDAGRFLALLLMHNEDAVPAIGPNPIIPAPGGPRP